MFNKLPKLSEVIAKDVLRPQISHVYMTKEHIYASDAHILVRLNTKAHFFEEFIEKIPSAGVFLDIYTLRALQKSNIDTVKLVSQDFGYLIEIIYHSGEHVFYPWKTVSDVGGKYPNCDHVISTIQNYGNWVAIDQFTFKAEYMYRLQRGLGDDIGLNCYFNGEDKGIYVLPRTDDIAAEGRIGILMPMVNPE